jgi:hypothetical protein
MPKAPLVDLEEMNVIHGQQKWCYASHRMGLLTLARHSSLLIRHFIRSRRKCLQGSCYKVVASACLYAAHWSSQIVLEVIFQRPRLLRRYGVA